MLLSEILTNDKKRDIFLDFKNLSIVQVGVKHGLDKFYKNRKSMESRVAMIRNEVQANPIQFGITKEVADAVNAAIVGRKRSPGVIAVDNPSFKTQGIDYFKTDEEYGSLEIKDLVGLSKKKSWVALNKKLDMLLKSREQVYKTPISMLAQVAGIVFDKGQIVKGEATEHIALRARIDENLTAEQKMELMQKLRERIAEKDKSEYQKLEEEPIHQEQNADSV